MGPPTTNDPVQRRAAVTNTCANRRGRERGEFRDHRRVPFSSDERECIACGCLIAFSSPPSPNTVQRRSDHHMLQKSIFVPAVISIFCPSASLHLRNSGLRRARAFSTSFSRDSSGGWLVNLTNLFGFRRWRRRRLTASEAARSTRFPFVANITPLRRSVNLLLCLFALFCSVVCAASLLHQKEEPSEPSRTRERLGFSPSFNLN